MANAARFLGYVQVQVGSKVFALPVQAVRFETDAKEGDAPKSGGFVSDEGKLGILVAEDTPPKDMQEQIASATQDAVRHLSRKFLN